MTENTENPKSREAIKRKNVKNALNRTRQTHHRETPIRPTKIIIKSRDSIIRIDIWKRTLSNYAQN